MTSISSPVKTLNTVGATVGGIVTTNGFNGTSHPSYGAIPPLTVGKVYTTNNTGSAGQFLTTGINGTTWANPNDNVMIVKQDPASLEVKGKVVINGVDLEERLNTIEKVLQIPERDVILEKKYPKLKRLYDEYIAALGKYRTFEAIKESK
jgi:hypothetical protein